MATRSGASHANIRADALIAAVRTFRQKECPASARIENGVRTTAGAAEEPQRGAILLARPKQTPVLSPKPPHAPSGHHPGVPVVEAPLELSEPNAVKRDDLEGILVESAASLLFATPACLFAVARGFRTG